MEDSSTYRELIETGRKLGWEEGREEGLQRAILELAQARLASPPEGLSARLSSMNAETLHALFVELLHARDDDTFRALLGQSPDV